MSTPVKLNALLTLNADSFLDLVVGQEYIVKKDGFRIMPFEIPMELADSNFNYLGKVKVIKLVVTPDSTEITFIVLKLFSPEEQLVYKNNFI